MKVVILAGGFGTRIGEESHLKPKPMVEIGEKPILWHIMKEYSVYGYNDFIICAGYKQNMIKEWFADYFLYNSDITFDFTDDNRMTVHNNVSEPWKVTVVDTGLNTQTGGRVRKVREYIGNDSFMLTYGDGVSDVDIENLVKFHENHGKMATLTAVRMESRFGVLDTNQEQVISFREKSIEDGAWINGGYMVLEPQVIDYIQNDMDIFESDTLSRIALDGQLLCYKHEGFWHCMDTMRDKEHLEKLWMNNKAPWKQW